MNTKTSRSDSDLETKKSGAGASDSLRRSAEQMLRTTRADISEMSPENVQRMIYELQVHQMELQLQNEELRDAQVALAETRDRYADLYEFAPVGYITLDQEGTILEGNLTAASMLPLEETNCWGRTLRPFCQRIPRMSGICIDLRCSPVKRNKRPGFSCEPTALTRCSCVWRALRLT